MRDDGANGRAAGELAYVVGRQMVSEAGSTVVVSVDFKKCHLLSDVLLKFTTKSVSTGDWHTH